MKVTILRELRRPPERPFDTSGDYELGSDAYHAARRDYLRAKRHYDNSMKRHRKLVAQDRKRAHDDE